MEWDDYDRFLLACTIIQLFFPVLAMMWLEHQRWLQVPKVIRQWAGGPRSDGWRAGGKADLFGRWLRRLAKLAIVAVAVGSLLWALNLPTPLRIEAR